MKKKIISAVLFTLVVIGVFVYVQLNRGGNVSRVSTSFTSNEFHSEKDIKESMSVVKKTFKKEFKGCTLTHLWYDHEVSNDSEDKWKQQYDGKDAIVLLSNFNVNGSGGDGSFNPNETYKNWRWILIKNSDGQWVLKTWGY